MRGVRIRPASARLASIAVSAGAVALWVSAAQAAMAPKECADALMAAMTASGVTATYTGATADGQSVTITGISGKQGTRNLSVATLIFVNPTPREPGGFTADKMEFHDAAATVRGNVIKAAAGTLEQTIVPSADEVTKRARVTPFAKASVSGITGTDSESAQQAPVSIDNVELSLGDIAKGVPHTMKLDVRGIAVDGKRIADLPIPAGVVDGAAGPGEIRFDVGIDTVYDSEKDALTIRAIKLSSPNIGSLTASAAVSGLPLSTLASDEKRNETALSATLDSATLRFENAGIVERMLDEQAKAAGDTRQAYLDKLLPKLPDLLGERLGSSDFQKQLAAAAADFLKDPKSITIESKPAAPVPVFLIGLAVLEIALGAPVDLSEVKDVQIKINQ